MSSKERPPAYKYPIGSSRYFKPQDLNPRPLKLKNEALNRFQDRNDKLLKGMEVPLSDSQIFRKMIGLPTGLDHENPIEAK